MQRRRAAAAAIASAALVAAGIGLTGCSSGGSEDDSSPMSSETGVVAPVTAPLDTVDGTTVEVPLDNVIVLTGDDETYTAWDATIADPAIVEFTPGKDDGSAQFDPGLEPLAVGETEVTLENTESGDSVTFTVVVTE
ncbi:hypothetical protein ACDF64_05420 [Agromyces sp. MMS24-JH15]|uniref:hypothetical protein n=1 Tax=Agromyces sp. MMS24-JH15 TaxID=3243765 RepID=UPI003749CC36